VAARYVFRTDGEYVAFLEEGFLFSSGGDWLGFVTNGGEVFARNGNFLGYLLQDDRIVRAGVERRWYTFDLPSAPPTPIRPPAPLRRLRMVPFPRPLEDVFEGAGVTFI
jgi:hypothetical protein